MYVKKDKGKMLNQVYSIPEKDLKIFKEKCEEQDVSMSYVLRMLIRSYCGINKFTDSWLSSVPEGIKKFIEEREVQNGIR